MRIPRQPAGLLPTLLLAVLVTVAGCGRVDDPATPAAATTTPPTTASPPTTGTPSAAEPAAAVPYHRYERLEPSPPVRVEIPRIGAGSELTQLGLRDDGSMEVPTDYDVAGWFTEGPQPGQVGPAVIAGHVDSKRGPAVFYRLRELRAGDEIHVTRADGQVLTFVVEQTRQYPKSELPAEAVFGPAPWPALRLITCGGEFNEGTGHYRDNIVVSARLEGA